LLRYPGIDAGLILIRALAAAYAGCSRLSGWRPLDWCRLLALHAAVDCIVYALLLIFSTFNADPLDTWNVLLCPVVDAALLAVGWHYATTCPQVHQGALPLA
jgi:hypothetical protein